MTTSLSTTSQAASLKIRPSLIPSIKPWKVKKQRISSQLLLNGRRSLQWLILISKAATRLSMTITESRNMNKKSSLDPTPRNISHRWSRRIRNRLKALKKKRSKCSAKNIVEKHSKIFSKPKMQLSLHKIFWIITTQLKLLIWIKNRCSKPLNQISLPRPL